jgi:hypothetical protein
LEAKVFMVFMEGMVEKLSYSTPAEEQALLLLLIALATLDVWLRKEFPKKLTRLGMLPVLLSSI